MIQCQSHARQQEEDIMNKEGKRLIMKKEFVPKEQTKELYDLGLRHKKGFEALACYYGDGLVKLVTTHGLPAPTYSQAFRWFEEEHNISLEYSVRAVMEDPDYYLRKLIEIVNGRNTKSNT